MLIDSHAHLDMQQFDEDRQKILERAASGGLTHILTVGTDLDSSLAAVALAQEYDLIYAAVGYHPHNAQGCDFQKLDKLARMTSEPKVVAWGEIGLDFFRNLSPPEDQLKVFSRQLEMANDLNLPVIIHDREAHKDIFAILKKLGKREKRGVIHCFSGDIDLAKDFIELGYYISIPGTVTYKKASQVKEVACGIPLERMLVETDAPFLAPVPKRGKRNEPLFVTYTAQEIARIRNIEFKEVARATAQNAKDLFGLK
ncbi:MAG: TatD family hydrolase [Desulfobacteraceae bacterium]|nr:TatD family hydrolase [Desulfobacteraceae bacterium]